MWFLLWIFIALFVLGVFAWSLYVLQEQKKAWSAFAKKAGMVYTGGKFTQAPIINGKAGGRKITFYTEAQQTNDVRGQRYVTVIELEFGRGLPVAAAIANREYEAFLSSIAMDDSWEPEGPDWNPSYIVRTRSKAALQNYLTPERSKLLHNLFSVKGSISLFFCDEVDAVLRIETADPLRNPERLDKLAKKLVKAADILDPLGPAPVELAPAQPAAPEDPAAQSTP